MFVYYWPLIKVGGVMTEEAMEDLLNVVGKVKRVGFDA